MSDAEKEIRAALRELGLADEDVPMARLGGGVSCDVYAVDLARGRVCVKRALSKLRVREDWYAPPERSQAEVAWIRLVAGIDKRLVPEIIAEHRARHLFVMTYLPPARYPVWKGLLSNGDVDSAFAARVGAELARIHRTTAHRQDIARAFANSAQFHALRIEPYLLFTAGRHPAVAGPITEMAAALAQSRTALMQGDISPKNILCGPAGPVFLDAETACYGDPAFDLAFCLNHFLLKSAWHPHHARALGAGFAALSQTYLAAVSWESPEALDRRAGGLLAALLLARIDGKSPVEYLVGAPAAEFVRGQALALLTSPPGGVGGVLERFMTRLADRR